jgi:hypothetical protein
VQHHPILADLIAAGYDIHVEHQPGLTCVRAVEPKTQRSYSARAENEFMAALFAKGKIDLNLPDEPPLRAAA